MFGEGVLCSRFRRFWVIWWKICFICGYK